MRKVRFSKLNRKVLHIIRLYIVKEVQVALQDISKFAAHYSGILAMKKFNINDAGAEKLERPRLGFTLNY